MMSGHKYAPSETVEMRGRVGVEGAWSVRATLLSKMKFQ